MTFFARQKAAGIYINDAVGLDTSGSHKARICDTRRSSSRAAGLTACGSFALLAGVSSITPDESVPVSAVSRQQTEPERTTAQDEIYKFPDRPEDRDSLQSFHFKAAFDSFRSPGARAFHAKQAKILQRKMTVERITPWTWDAALAAAKLRRQGIRYHHPRRKSKSLKSKPSGSEFPWDDLLTVILAEIAVERASAPKSAPPLT